MPADKVERWQRQVGLKYSGLTEREKESDREQADKISRHCPRAIFVVRTAIEHVRHPM
jgi:hypothetical protein